MLIVNRILGEREHRFCEQSSLSLPVKSPTISRNEERSCPNICVLNRPLQGQLLEANRKDKQYSSGIIKDRKYLLHNEK
jgi:hypothetical protein